MHVARASYDPDFSALKVAPYGFGDVYIEEIRSTLGRDWCFLAIVISAAYKQQQSNIWKLVTKVTSPLLPGQQ